MVRGYVDRTAGINPLGNPVTYYASLMAEDPLRAMRDEQRY
jgi:hypothetical protein